MLLCMTKGMYADPKKVSAIYMEERPCGEHYKVVCCLGSKEMSSPYLYSKQEAETEVQGATEAINDYLQEQDDISN